MRESPLLSWPAAALALTLPVAAGCGGPAPDAPPAPVVTVAAPVERTFTDHVDFSGKAAAVESVQLRACVGGCPQKVNYREGDDVKMGQASSEIDLRPYQWAGRTQRCGAGTDAGL